MRRSRPRRIDRTMMPISDGADRIGAVPAAYGAPAAMTRFSQRLARLLYAMLLRAALPLYLWRLWRRGAREPWYRRAWGERIGLYRGRVEPGALWLHAVSLGETRAAAPLIEALREQQPGLRLL